MKDNFKIILETWHKPGKPELENVSIIQLLFHFIVSIYYCFSILRIYSRAKWILIKKRERDRQTSFLDLITSTQHHLL